MKSRRLSAPVRGPRASHRHRPSHPPPKTGRGGTGSARARAGCTVGRLEQHGPSQAPQVTQMQGRHVGLPGHAWPVVTVDDVRGWVADLPRSYEVLVHDRIKFRVGSMVYVAFSRDERELGVGFPKDERADAVAARPEVFGL